MLNRKLARELYRSQGLLLAITSIIAVGVTCYVTMQSAYHNLSAAKERYYRQCQREHYTATSVCDHWPYPTRTSLDRGTSTRGVVSIGAEL